MTIPPEDGLGIESTPFTFWRLVPTLFKLTLPGGFGVNGHWRRATPTVSCTTLKTPNGENVGMRRRRRRRAHTGLPVDLEQSIWRGRRFHQPPTTSVTYIRARVMTYSRTRATRAIPTIPPWLVSIIWILLLVPSLLFLLTEISVSLSLAEEEGSTGC